jgi:hypothetical protein
MESACNMQEPKITYIAPQIELLITDAERGSNSLSDSLGTMSVSKSRGIVIIVTLAGMNFLNTMGSGILIAALPRIAKDVGIPDSLILW